MTNFRYRIILLTMLFASINIVAQHHQLSAKEKLKFYPSKDVVSRYHNDWTIKHYKACINMFKDAPLEFNGIVFIGNSITEKGRDWTKKTGIPNIYNRGIAGDVTDGVLKRLDEIVYFKPKAVFILIGINDLFNKHYKEGDGRFKYDKIVPSANYVGKNILKIAKYIKHKSPKTKVYVRTVLPTNKDYINTDVVLVNHVIKVNEVKGFYTVVDLYKQFADSNGRMIKELTVDGVHLSEKGYEKWVDFEKSIIENLE